MPREDILCGRRGLTMPPSGAVKDDHCWHFLLSVLPRMGYDTDGFRKVRGQVCKRIARRLRRIQSSSLDEYRSRLAADPNEWTALDHLCRITITRFCREWPAFEQLRDDVLPELAAAAERNGRTALRAWSAGCGGGEEPYSLRILWDLEIAPRYPSATLEIVATDADSAMLRRALDATYRRGTLREMPDTWVRQAFDATGGEFRLRPAFRRGIHFVRQDIRHEMPDGPFDLVLCRYLAFTYFDSAGQRATLHAIANRLRPGGVLMVGRKERPPDGAAGLEPANPKLGLWRRSRTP